jgi:hypothetical protein
MTDADAVAAQTRGLCKTLARARSFVGTSLTPSRSARRIGSRMSAFNISSAPAVHSHVPWRLAYHFADRRIVRDVSTDDPDTRPLLVQAVAGGTRSCRQPGVTAICIPLVPTRSPQ